jgi:hypothetical protein
MKVHIEGSLYLESDPYNFILREYTTKKDGQGAGKTIVHGYFSNVQAALKKVVKMKIKESTAKTLQELVEDVRRIEEYIHSRIRD